MAMPVRCHIMPTCAVVAPAIAPLDADEDAYGAANIMMLRNTTVGNFPILARYRSPAMRRDRPGGPDGHGGVAARRMAGPYWTVGGENLAEELGLGRETDRAGALIEFLKFVEARQNIGKQHYRTGHLATSSFMENRSRQAFSFHAQTTEPLIRLAAPPRPFHSTSDTCRR